MDDSSKESSSVHHGLPAAQETQPPADQTIHTEGPALKNPIGEISPSSVAPAIKTEQGPGDTEPEIIEHPAEKGFLNPRAKPAVPSEFATRLTAALLTADSSVRSSINTAVTTLRTSLQSFHGTSGVDASGLLTRVPVVPEQIKIDDELIRTATAVAQLFRNL
jgi:hypothetical protein